MRDGPDWHEKGVVSHDTKNFLLITSYDQGYNFLAHVHMKDVH